MINNTVQNKPLISRNPLGLSQESVNRGKQVLKGLSTPTPQSVSTKSSGLVGVPAIVDRSTPASSIPQGPTKPSIAQAPQSTYASVTPQPPVQQQAPQAPTNFNQNFSDQVIRGGGVATPQAPSRGLFSDVISSLAGRGSYVDPMTTESYGRAQRLAEDLRQSRQNQITAEGQQALAPIPKGVAFGRQANVARQYEAQQAALSSQLQAEATLAGIGQQQQTIQQQALGSAAGFVPEPLRYGVFSGQQGGGQFDPGTTASQYAQEVASGARTYDDAVQAMGLYGSAGKQFLDSAIRNVSPNFNFAQAQSLSDVQGRVGPQYNFANEALSNVEKALQTLSSSQKTNVPLWNQFTNFLSLQSGIGGEQTRQFVGAVQSLRNAYASLLATAKGGIPSDYSAQAIAEVPDIPTPNDLAAIRHNMETLGQARIGIYGSPGGAQAPMGTNYQQGGLFDW